MSEGTEPKAMKGLTEGRIVHYVLEHGLKHGGEHRPAQIVKIWNPTTGLVNLVVTLDGSNDQYGPVADHFLHQWVTSVEYSEEPRPRTWHWIEPA